MNNTDLTIIKNSITRQIVDKFAPVLIIAGKPGIAKSTTVNLIAQELGMGISTESASAISIETLSGGK